MINFEDRMIREMEIRGLLAGTIREYLRAVSLFDEHCDKPLDKVEIQDLKDYQYYLLKERKRKLSPRSVNKQLSAIKFFYRFVLGRYEFKDAIPRVKPAKMVPTILSVDEVKLMIDSVNNVQYKAIVMTLYSCGLRISELQKVKISDIDNKRMLLRVHGKNNKQRYVVISPMLLSVLRTYWRLFRIGKATSDYLFIPNKINPNYKPGKSISCVGINYVVKTAVKAANIKKK